MRTIVDRLTDITGIGGGVAKSLKEQNIDNIEDLADADPEEISVPTGNGRVLVQRAAQRTIKSQSAAEMLDEYEDTEYLPTGVEEVDEMMGGGWEPETIGVVYGKSSQGKSQLTFSTMAQVASEGSVVYLQTEMQSKSVAQRLADMAESKESLSSIQFYEAYSVQDQYNTYNKITDENPEMDLLVIDSFTAQFRMTDDFSGRENLGERSEEMGRHLNKLGEMARKYSIPIVMTGQVYPQPEAYGQGDVLWGGEKMRHFVSFFLRMSNGKGELKEVSLENHPGISEESVQVNITDDGIEGISQ